MDGETENESLRRLTKEKGFSDINTRSVTIKAGFSEIIDNGLFRESTLKKGKKLAEKHIFNVEEIHEIESGKIIIRGRSIRQTSIRKPPYYIELFINNNREIESGYCSCHGGAQANCKHSSAVVTFINNERCSSKNGRIPNMACAFQSFDRYFSEGKENKKSL